MATISLTPERMAQLEEYAKRRGQDPTSALDSALSEYLQWETGDARDLITQVGRGYADVKAGRTRPASELLAELRRKHEIPG